MITNDRTIEYFSRFHSLRLKTAEKIRSALLQHDDYKLPSKFYGIGSIVFSGMAGDFKCGLISELNRFLINVHHADCWVQAANHFTENEKLGFLWEFADPLLELSVGRAYSIKNHFAFAVVHLLNQANVLSKKSKDNLPPDHRITIEYLTKSKMGDDWNNFAPLLEILCALNDESFVKATRNYRNLIQHRFRPHFHTGLTTYFDRIEKNGQVSYTYKAMFPMTLETVISELYRQHETASEVFKVFWKLLNELCVNFTTKPAAESKAIIIDRD